MKRRRIIAVAIVLLAGALAFAAPGGVPGLYTQPEVVTLTRTMGSGGSGSAMFINDSTSAIIVDELNRDASCTTNQGTGITLAIGVPFTVAGPGSAATGVSCPTTGPSAGGFGIRRCLFHATDTNSAVPLADLTVLCLYPGMSALTPSTPSVSFGNVAVGSASMSATVVVSAPAGITGVYLSVGDQRGNFKITAPCMGDVEHCHANIATPPGGAFSVGVRCTPTQTGALSAALHVIGDNGENTTIGLTCNGTSTTGGTISVNPTTVTLAHPVNQGSASDFVIIQNVGMDALEIASITKTGSTDWSMALAGGCSALPCTLPAMGSAALTTVFQPTAIGPANGTITITSNDPMASTKVVTLAGTGTGTTLGLNGPPAIDFGSVPIGGQSLFIVDVRNDPATERLDVMATATPAGIFAVDQPMFDIAPNSVTPIGLICKPDAPPRTIAGTITLAGSATFGSPIEIAVTCTATGGSLFAVPSSIALGEVRIGASRVTPIELRTNGPMLTISGNPALATAIPGVSLTPPSSPTITSVAPSTFELRVTPAQDGDLANAIEVAASSETIEIPVTGRAVTPSISVPADVHLGTFCIDQPTRPSVLELLANGTATIAMPAKPALASTTSPFALTYTQPAESGYPYALAASERATVEILPTQQTAPGAHEDVLVWQTDMPGNASPRTRLRVEYEDAGPAISPRTADFGGVPRGQSSMTKTITLQNCGTEPLTVMPPRFIPDGEFRDVSPEPLPSTLAPSQVATITLTFFPARSGPRTSRMEIATSAGLLEVELLGLGLGTGDDDGAKTSFYACGCKTHDPTGVLAIGLVLVIAVVPRRRRR